MHKVIESDLVALKVGYGQVDALREELEAVLELLVSEGDDSDFFDGLAVRQLQQELLVDQRVEAALNLGSWGLGVDRFELADAVLVGREAFGAQYREALSRLRGGIDHNFIY